MRPSAAQGASDTLEIEGINLPITVSTTEVTAGFGKVRDELGKMNGEATKVGEGVKKLGNDMTTSSTKVKDGGAAMEGSFRSLAVGMSQMMTSAFSLYQSIDNIEKKQYALEKAQLAAKKATEAVDQAQKDYNEAVTKFGANSPQAIDAQDKLALAQETASLSTDRVQLSQNNLNDSMMMAGLTVIPAVISGIDGMGKMWKNIQGMNIGGAGGILEKIKGGLQGLGSDKAGLLFSVGAGVGALGFIFAAFTSKSPEIKLACSIMGGALVALAAKQWIMNTAATYGLGLTGAGAILIGVAVAAAAATYALSEMYGAKAEAPPETPTGAGGGGAGGGSLAEQAKALTLANVWEMPTQTPGAGMTGKEMAAAGLGEYIKQTGVFIPKEEALIHDDIAFKVSAGANKGKYKWIREGPAEDMYFTMEELKAIQGGDRPEINIRPWFTFGLEERTDDLGNVWLQGKHFQRGGLPTRDVFGFVEKDEAVLPLTDPQAMNKISLALGGAGGRTIINYFNINGARDVDLVMDEIARKLWGTLK